MAPPSKELEQALIDGTCEVFGAEPDGTSVNKVRRHVEEKLGLEEGFFTGGSWKQKSKALIKEYVDKLLDGWKPDTKQPESKNGVKRQSSELESPEPKRRKRASKSGKPVKKEESDASESDQKPKGKKHAGRGKPLADNSDSSPPDTKPKTKHGQRNTLVDTDGDKFISPSPDRKRKRNAKEDSVEEGKEMSRDEPDEEEAQVTQVKTGVDSGDEKDSSVKQQVDSDGDAKSTIKVEEAIPAIDEEEEYSDVIDEPPQRKKKATAEKKGAPSKPPKTGSKKAVVSSTTPDDPNEAEIKKLQSHLVKCGIRKLWHMELKKYGDDARAKIRHLKKMLTDVGMDGRFSEAKAREIRETRELLAETEAAQEMNRLWGMSSGGRASRSKSKTMKAEDSEESDAGDVKDEEEEKEEDDGESNTFAARRRRAQADLAFLGDDSDSD